MQIIPTRVFFEKQGRLKYISHLDTMNVFIRALTRAKLPVWLTEGFHPHVYITFPFPLSLGYEGQRECFDIRFCEVVDPEAAKTQLNRFLPPAMQVLSVASPQMDAGEAMWADYTLRMEFALRELEAAEQQLAEFATLPEIWVEKKSKKGSNTVDIAAGVQLLEHSLAPPFLIVRVRLAAGNRFNCNPRLYQSAFSGFSGFVPKHMAVVRHGIYNSMLQHFC